MGTLQVTPRRLYSAHFWRFLILLALGACATRSAQANDSAFSGIPGSPEARQLKGEHRAIRMQSEGVVLTAGQDSFETNANFVFRNDTERRVTVTMGFPEINFGDGWEGGTTNNKSGFTRFATWVDGKSVKAKRTPEKIDNGYDAYWLKTVTFGPHQTRRVRVETTSPYGGTVDWGFRNTLSYAFTGGNWKGQVSRSDLEIRVSRPGTWNAVGRTFSGDKRSYWKPALEMRGHTAVLKRTWRNWQAEGTVYVGLTPTLPGWMVDTIDDVSVYSPDVVPNTVTFRAGGKTEKPRSIDRGAAPVFIHRGTAMVALWYLTNRLSSLQNTLPEAKQSKVSLVWNQKTHETSLASKRWSATFKAGLPLMQTFEIAYPAPSHIAHISSQVSLPVAPLMVRDSNGDAMLYVPLVAVARVAGLGVTTDLPHHQFKLARVRTPAP